MQPDPDKVLDLPLHLVISLNSFNCSIKLGTATLEGRWGFTQRQAGGKFTVEEADGFIAELEEQLMTDDGEPATRNCPA